MTALDLLGPHRGPCAFCGGDDARHRLADSLVEQVRAGDSPAHVAAIYEIEESVVTGLVAHADRQRRRHKARWA